MTDDLIKALVLSVFALVLTVLNIHTYGPIIKRVTYYGMLASVAGAGYFVVAGVWP